MTLVSFQVIFFTMIWVYILAGVLTSYPVINEVSYGDLEWVEIYNPHATSISLSGWQIRNAWGSDVLSGTIPPQGYIVIVTSRTQFESAYPNFVGELAEISDGSIGSGLGTNDMLQLINPHGDVVDQVNWGEPDYNWPNANPSLWSPGVPTRRNIIGRIPNGQDTDQVLDWRGIRAPTPGTENLVITGLTPSSWGKIKAIFSVPKLRM